MCGCPDAEVLGITAARNIVAHAGNGTTDDDVFWDTVTKRVPEIVERLLSREE